LTDRLAAPSWRGPQVTAHGRPTIGVVAGFALHVLALLLCLAAGALHAADPDQRLIAAAARGDTAEVRKLLLGGASHTARDADGRTALVAAAYGNHVEAASVLMQAGADVNVRDTVGRTAFMVAAVYGHVEILRLALKHGADVNTLNQYQGTALIPASHYGHVEVVRELLRTKINIDHVNRFGWTALIEAVILGDGGPRHTEIVRLLVAHGANARIADPDGVTPLMHARRRGFAQIVQILERSSAPEKTRPEHPGKRPGDTSGPSVGR